MSIPDYKKKEANVKQFEAAKDNNKKVMLIAGPDTGKSYTIAKWWCAQRLLTVRQSNIGARCPFTLPLTARVLWAVII